MSRVYNFCAGPCTLPLPVLEAVRDELVDFRGTGMSLIELSHRSPAYEDVHEEAIASFRQVFGVPEDFEVLFLQGGATLLFSTVPMNLVAEGEPVAYVRSGTWGRTAEQDAAVFADAYPAWDGAPHGYTRMPRVDELEIRPGTRYLHVTSNETIEGIRVSAFPDVGVPLVADMSSDYLSRPIPGERFDLVYGGAQKNLGPAGLAVVVVRRERLGEPPRPLGSYLRFDLHAERRSLLNTPPMFAIYVMGKVLAWIRSMGGVEAMERRAAERSGRIYAAIDTSDGFYRSPVDRADRSHMNVVFRLPTEELEAAFLRAAEAEGLVNLKGHRSVGGIRASVYNAMPDEGVDALVTFMRAFAEQRA
jgi:phosphoserine aminotransferase